MWHMDILVVTDPIVIRTTDEIPRNLRNNLTQLNWSWELFIELKNSVFLGTFSIVRKVIRS